MNNPIMIPMTISSDQAAYDMSATTAIQYLRGRLQEKEVWPDETTQTATPSEDYDALSEVIVHAIPSDYVGSTVARRSSADLTASGGTVTAPAGYYDDSATKTLPSGSATVDEDVTANPSITIDGEGKIRASVDSSAQVTPIVQEGYITEGTAGTIDIEGSAELQLTKRTSNDLSASGQNVTAPAGYYPSSASKAVQSGTEGTPTATKGAVSNHSVDVTPRVTNAEGYIGGGTHTGDPVTVSASELVSGTKNISANGESDVTDYQKVNVSVPGPNLQTKSKTYTPTTSQQTEAVTADQQYDGLSRVNVTVDPIPSQYIVPSGTKLITENASGVDVTQYASVDVEVPAPAPNLQTKSKSYTPSETAQSEAVTADSQYDGLGRVNVNVGAVPSDYVGSGVTRRSSSDLSVSGRTVNVPAGYYEDDASKSVTQGTAGTPTATKGAVSNHSVQITPSVTNTTGYIQGGTSNGEPVTVQASELVSGTKNITQNGNNIDVTNYEKVNVNVSGGAPSYETKSKTYTPSETQQTDTLTPSSGYDAIEEADITIEAIPSNYVGSGVTRRSSSDMSVNGGTVTAPAGYYENAGSKAVQGMTLPTTTQANPLSGAVEVTEFDASTFSTDRYLHIPSGYNDTLSYYKLKKAAASPTINSLTVTPSTSQQTFNASGVDGYKPVVVEAMPSGSVTPPSSISDTGASVNIQTNKVTFTKTVPVTPVVSTAGYVSAGTQGNTAVSLEADLVINKYYTGSSAPSSSLGNNGDLYLKV